ncbi:MAG TPA: DUF1189 family protein [Syntrophorhabdaceae bacterium]|nr:DUF1189 family protein [Syntrophorhabdaceae bacterium]
MHSFFNLFCKPFYSREYYHDVIHHWRGKNLLLLLLVTAFVLIPTVFEITDTLSRFVDTEAPFYIEQAPEIKIKDGVLKIDRVLPYDIKTKKHETVVAFVDDAQVGKADPEAPVVVTTHKLMVKKNARETKTYDVKQMNGITITKKDLYHWSGYLRLGGILVYPLMVVGLYLYYLLMSLIVFLTGLCLLKFLKSPMDKESLYRLTVVAMLPMIYCTTVLELSDVSVPYLTFASLLVSAAYLVYGIRANNASRTNAPSEEEESGRQG